MYNSQSYLYPQAQAGYRPPIIPTQTQPTSALKGRPVASLDEARASSIDFDGSIFYFPDLANKCIYTKQINMDGTLTMNCYELKPMPIPQTANPNNYVTKEEFEQVIEQLRKAIPAPEIGPPIEPISAPTEAVPQFNF